MKKTVTVNISGIVFTIDEDAYDKLQKYIHTIKGYFKKSEGCDEIIADIEARIAEMFQEKIDSRLQVVSILHVEEMITIMGNPEDFIDDETQAETEYKTPQTEYKTKQLYRDGDGNVFGGVCSGLGYYFGFNPMWLRLAFSVAVFASFGAPIPIYIILWMVTPKARTTAEKLEMKGEKVNIDNIGKSIEDEMENIKTKFSNGASNWRNENHEKISAIFHRFFDFIFIISKSIAKIFGKLVGIGLLFFGILMLIPVLFSFLDSSELFISWTPQGIHTISIPSITSLIFGTEELASITLFALSLFIGIPAVFIIYGGIKLIFGIKTEVKGLNITLTSLWIIGIVLLCYSGYRLGLEFKSENQKIDLIELAQLTGDTLTISITKDIIEMPTNKRHKYHGETFSLLKMEGHINYNGDVELTIKETEQDIFSIEIISKSRGKSKTRALEYIREINYNYSITENSILFDPYFSIDSTSQLRGQEIDIIVYVPKGKSVTLSNELLRILYNVNNYTNTLGRDMVNKTWTMTERGLECIDCNKNEL